MRPSLHQFRIYGTQNGLILDHDQETMIKLRGERFKSHLEKFVPPLDVRPATSRKLGQEHRNFPGKGSPHELRYEVFDRVFLPFDP